MFCHVDSCFVLFWCTRDFCKDNTSSKTDFWKCLERRLAFLCFILNNCGGVTFLSCHVMSCHAVTLGFVIFCHVDSCFVLFWCTRDFCKDNTSSKTDFWKCLERRLAFLCFILNNCGGVTFFVMSCRVMSRCHLRLCHVLPRWLMFWCTLDFPTKVILSVGVTLLFDFVIYWTPPTTLTYSISLTSLFIRYYFHFSGFAWNTFALNFTNLHLKR